MLSLARFLLLCIVWLDVDEVVEVLALWLGWTFIHLQYSLDVEFFLNDVDLLYQLTVREEFLKLYRRFFFGIEVVNNQALRLLIALSFDQHHFLYIEEIWLTIWEVGLTDDWFEFIVFFAVRSFLLGLVDVNPIGWALIVSAYFIRLFCLLDWGKQRSIFFLIPIGLNLRLEACLFHGLI